MGSNMNRVNKNVPRGALAGRTDAGSSWNVDDSEKGKVVGQRVLALREALGMKQHEVANGMRAGLDRSRVAKIERGDNQLSSNQARRELAQAFRIPRDDLGDYLDGVIGLQEVLSRRSDSPLTEDLPHALLAVLSTDEGRSWTAFTRGALKGGWTASREPRTEQPVVVADDAVEARRAKHRAKRH